MLVRPRGLNLICWEVGLCCVVSLSSGFCFAEWAALGGRTEPDSPLIPQINSLSNIPACEVWL